MSSRFRFRNMKLAELFQRALLWCFETFKHIFRSDRAKRRMNEQDQSLKILVTGTKSSGKTTVCLRLTTRKRNKVDCLRDTKGASNRCYTTYRTEYQGEDVKLCELSGEDEESYHDYPPAYFYARVHGVIYVLNVSKPSEFDKVRDDLQRLMTHPYLRNKPFLVIANKVDLLTRPQFKRIERTIADRLNLRYLTLRTKTMTQTTIVSAISLHPANDLLPAGEWLLSEIHKDFKELKARVREERAIFARDEFDKNSEVVWIEDDLKPLLGSTKLAISTQPAATRESISYKNRRRKVVADSVDRDKELERKASDMIAQDPSEEGDKINENLDLKIERCFNNDLEGRDKECELHGGYNGTVQSEDFFNVNIPGIKDYVEMEIFEPVAATVMTTTVETSTQIEQKTSTVLAAISSTVTSAFSRKKKKKPKKHVRFLKTCKIMPTDRDSDTDEENRDSEMNLP